MLANTKKAPSKFRKYTFLCLCMILSISSCKSSPGRDASASMDAPAGYIPIMTDTNAFEGIPVEVRGIPYGFKDICGNYDIDYVIRTLFDMMSTGQASSFMNFKIEKFIFDFKGNGSLVASTIYSHDRTPSENGRFFPAATRTHEWDLPPYYHYHEGNVPCSKNRYDDIAVSQAKLNEKRRDPSLNKIYEILLSVARDVDYDFQSIGQRVHYRVRPTLLGLCDGYADLLIDRLGEANIRGVSNITKVTGQNHAWVTLRYDGKTLYLDATWLDGQSMTDGFYDNTPHRNPMNMTFDNNIFTNYGKHHIPGGNVP